MTALKLIAATALVAVSATAQISGLCNTGETSRTAFGCSGVMVAPNPPGGGGNRDHNWELVFPYPAAPETVCSLRSFVRAWVDTPNQDWFPNSASPASEWITPYDGEGLLPVGSYVYRTIFHVPFVLPSGVSPTSVTINGRLASDDSTYGFYMRNLADGSCSFVPGLPIPINPDYQFTEWWNFSFTNPIAITPGSDLLLYILVENAYNPGFPQGRSPTGLRVEFFSTSAFH